MVKEPAVWSGDCYATGGNLVAFVVKQGKIAQSKEIQKQQVLALIMQKQITRCPDVKNVPISNLRQASVL